jgi:hypothetical protein
VLHSWHLYSMVNGYFCENGVTAVTCVPAAVTVEWPLKWPEQSAERSADTACAQDDWHYGVLHAFALEAVPLLLLTFNCRHRQTVQCCPCCTPPYSGSMQHLCARRLVGVLVAAVQLASVTV